MNRISIGAPTANRVEENVSSPVGAGCVSLRNAIKDLGERITMLENRINPVLGPELPASPDKEPAPSGCCDVERAINEATRMVQSLTGRVMAICDRVAV